MGNIISEGLENIGRIDESGYIYDKSGRRFAVINQSGYIGQIGGGKIYGKIDEDGTIRDSLMNVVGRIQADGYVYIHSKRVANVSSVFIERITPDAWNAGDASTYSGRQNTAKDSCSNDLNSGTPDFFSSPFFIKLVIGIVLGIICMVNGMGIESLIAAPFMVFMFSFFAKLFE